MPSVLCTKQSAVGTGRYFNAYTFTHFHFQLCVLAFVKFVQICNMTGRVFTLAQRLFIIKTFYQSGIREVFHTWEDNFDDEPPTRDAVYKLKNKSEHLYTLHDTPRSGRPKTAMTEAKLELVAAQLVDDPCTSSRGGSLQVNLSWTSYRRIRRKLKFKCYRPRLIHGLVEDDSDRRLQYCELLNQFEEDPTIFSQILWTDEAQFKLSGHVNRHNCVYSDLENPHITIEEQLNQPGIVVWGGIAEFGVFGMLQNWLIPGLKMHCDNFNEIYYMQDGAPAHYTISVRTYLDETFDERVIGRRGSIEWPARSLDLTPMDFYFWGVVKDKVFARKPTTLQELRDFIGVAFDDIEHLPMTRKQIREHIPERLKDCINNGGKQFEYLK